MSFILTVWEIIASSLTWFLGLFFTWIHLFLAPLKNPDILWILIPVWITWFFAEFFQEKRSTTFGNAITNGAVPTWVGIDWLRTIVNELTHSNLAFSGLIFLKITICFLVIVYGIVIIYGAIRTLHYTRYIGKIRVVTYVLVMFTPLVYGVYILNWHTILAVILFFPVYYYVIEVIDYYVPDPKPYQHDNGEHHHNQHDRSHHILHMQNNSQSQHHASQQHIHQNIHHSQQSHQSGQSNYFYSQR